jgi:hypothetical protein
MRKKVVRKKKQKITKRKSKPANGDYDLKYEAMMYYTLRYNLSATKPQCNCPGHVETCIELLVIDHKKKRTKEEKGLAGKPLYEYLKKNNYPDGYQVLCFSCNFVKEKYDKCPHLFEKYRKKKATESKSTKKKAAKKTKKKRRKRSR